MHRSEPSNILPEIEHVARLVRRKRRRRRCGLRSAAGGDHDEGLAEVWARVRAAELPDARRCGYRHTIEIAHPQRDEACDDGDIDDDNSLADTRRIATM